MSKITLTDLVNLENETTAVNAINNNNATIEGAFDNTLSRDGTQPNTMSSNLDMNNNRILNLPTPVSNFEPIRAMDAATLSGGGVISVNTLPAGGSTGQQLTKNSATNFDASWKTNQPVIAGGSTGQVLGKNSGTDYDLSWKNSVTSIGVTAPADFTVTNSPVTTTGTIALTYATTPSGTGALLRQNSPTIATPSINTIVSGGASLTLPVTTDTLIGRATTDTLTNKSIAATQLTGTLGSSQMPALTGDVTTAGGSFNTTIAANAVTNSKLNTMPAFTVKGNATNATANPTDISIPALTQKSSPVAGDMLMIVDSAASNALKFATVGSVASAGSVSSVGGLTGAITLGSGLTTSGGTTILSDPALVGEVRQVAFNRVPANFLAADGSAKSRASFPLLYANLVVAATVTVTIASPAVMTWTSNLLQNNDPILLSTTGALPTGLAAATKYYVKGLSGNTFNLSLTPGGAAINTTGTQSGTHTGTNAPWEGTAVGDGSTTFTLPNLNGQFLRGIDNGAAKDTNRSFGTAELDQMQGHKHTTNINFQLFGPAGGSATFYAPLPASTNPETSTTPITDGVNGTPRTGLETRPINQALLYIIRYQ